MAEVLITEHGNVRNQEFESLLWDEQWAIRNTIITIIRQELLVPDSELINLIKEVMNTIADEEIVKVLE